MRKFLLILLLVPVVFAAQTFPAEPSNYVTDDAGILGPDEEHRLNGILKAFEDSTSTQIFIYTARSLSGQEMFDVCQNIFHTWKIGQEKKNNGVLIGIFVGDHKFRIHTGRGMEGILPDLRTKKIQDQIMRPYFKENNYFMGLVEGVNRIIYYSKHEYTADEKQMIDWGGLLFMWIFNLVLFIIFLIVRAKKKGSWNDARRTRSVLTILAIIFTFIPILGSVGLFILMIVVGRRGSRRSGRGSYSSGDDSSWGYSSSSSSDYSSSSSDSSFDGGGGGDSGGGGSNSDW